MKNLELQSTVSEITKCGKCKTISYGEVKLTKTARTKVCGVCGFTKKANLKNCPNCSGKGTMSPIMELPSELANLHTITNTVRYVANSYQDLINNHLTKGGLAPEFVSDKTYTIPVEGASNKFILEGVDKKTEEPNGKFYLRTYVGHLAGAKNIETFYVSRQEDDSFIVVDDFITQQIRDEFFPLPKTGSQKQAEHGVTNEVEPRNIKVENVLYFQKGQAVYNRLHQDVMNLFDLQYV